MAGHRPGEMDTTEQRKTFNGFVRMAGYVVVAVAVILVILTFRI